LTLRQAHSAIAAHEWVFNEMQLIRVLKINYVACAYQIFHCERA
jgi:hypothetical protein